MKSKLLYALIALAIALLPLSQAQSSAIPEDQLTDEFVSSVQKLLLCPAAGAATCLGGIVSIISAIGSTILGIVSAFIAPWITGAAGALAGGIISCLAGIPGGLSIGPFICMALSSLCSFLFCGGLTCVPSTLLFCCVSLLWGPTLLFDLCWSGFNLIYHAFIWTWVTAGGLGPGMVIYACFSLPWILLNMLSNLVCNLIPGLNCAFDIICQMPSYCCLACVTDAWLIIFDLCYSIGMPILTIVGDLIGMVNVVSIFLGLIDIFCVQSVNLCMGCIWLTGDLCIAGISLLLFPAVLLLSLALSIFGTPVLLLLSPIIALAFSLFLGTAFALVGAIVGLVLGIPFGFIIGPILFGILGAAAGALIGAVAGVVLALLSIPALIAVAIGIGILAALFSLAYFAELLGFEGAVSALMEFLTSSWGSFTRFIREGGRSILNTGSSVLAGVKETLQRVLPSCTFYLDLGPLFFSLCYALWAIFGALGCVCCCVPTILSVFGMLVTFIAQLLWNLFYKGADVCGILIGGEI